MSTSRSPRYLALAEQFRAQVRSGVLQPGDRLPSFTEMRAEHGVGQATMERVHKVLEADGLIKREVGRGTFITRPNRKVRSGIIGLCGHGFAYADTLAYSAHLVAELRPTLASAQMQVMLLDDDSGVGWEKADGVLIYDSHPARIMRRLPVSTPCVSVLYEVEAMPSVVADDFSGAHQATEHLLSLGHRRIAYLTTMGSSITKARLAGHRAAMRAAKIKIEPRWLRRLHRPATELEWMSAGQEQMRAWLDDDWRELGCTALLVQNDLTAIGVLQALREAGIAVPEEVSVVGFDGLELCDYVTPRLTSVSVPLRQIGALGLQLLLQQIESGKVQPDASRHVLPVALKVRKSTAAPRSKQ